MKKSSFDISIPTPCHESWDAMTPAEQGRFCQNCQKVVTDFSGMSDHEIMSFFSNRQDNICGRFLSTQLNRTLEQPIVNKRSRKPFAAIVALITALTISIPSAKALKKAGKVYVAPDKKHKRDTSITNAHSTELKSIEILPLSGMTQKCSIKKVDAPTYNFQPTDSGVRVLMGGVASSIKIEPKERLRQTTKTSIWDFF